MTAGRDVVADRQATHGNFAETAEVAQSVKMIWRSHPGWGRLSYVQRETLEMDAVKSARIICGDPNFPDHWRDKAGYAELNIERPAPTHCVGFFFDASRSRVWLIRKERPDWQRGRLNGIGGKIEPGETALAAMVREFEEEVGFRVDRWEEVVRLEHRARAGVIAFFRAFAASEAEFLAPRTMTDEQVGFYPVFDVIGLRSDVLPGLRVEIPLALDTSGLLLPVSLRDVSP